VYRQQQQASDVFPGEVPPHVPAILFDLLRGQRNTQVCPQAFDTLEGELAACFETEPGGVVENFLLFLSR
jgi:hypothetical protein